MRRHKLKCLASVGIVLIGCITLVVVLALRVQEARFAPPSEEVMRAINPYLEEWATLPPEQTEAQRNKIDSEVDAIIGIAVFAWATTDGDEIQVVTVGLDQLLEWTRNYLYVHESGITLVEYSNMEFKKLDDHSYIYIAKD